MLRLAVSLLLASLSISSVSSSSACPHGIRLRKEVRDLSNTEWSAFAKAVKQLQSGPSPTPYDAIVKIHVDNQAAVHGYPLFFSMASLLCPRL